MLSTSYDAFIVSQSPSSSRYASQNVPCGSNGVTCAKSITLRIGARNNQEVVEFSKDKPIPTMYEAMSSYYINFLDIS